MTTRIAINGFGRMGRLALRAGWHRKDLDFVHINDSASDAGCSAHLLEFDSVHGRWPTPVRAENDRLIIDGQPVTHTSHARPEDLDLGSKEIDLVIEATGAFRRPEQLEAHFRQGVKKVVVAAPVKGALNVVMGVNHDRYDPREHDIVTAASCTTNCLAPVVKALHKRIGIRHGTMTTIHDMTNTQTIVDRGHKDLRRARAASQSLIPTSTGSARAITDIFPELRGRLNGLAVRVPLLNASLTDFVFEAERSVTEAEINDCLRQAAKGELAGILGFEDRPLVSVDFKDDTRSSIVDGPSTMVIDGTQVKVLAWYDNEIGYANRLVELAAMVGNRLP